MFKVKHMPAALFSAAEPARCAPRPRSPRAPPLRALPEGQRCFQPGKRQAKRLWEREKGGDKNPNEAKPVSRWLPGGKRARCARGRTGGCRAVRAGRGHCGSAALGEGTGSALCVRPPSRNGAQTPRKALGSGFDSLETLVIIMLRVKNVSVNL